MQFADEIKDKYLKYKEDKHLKKLQKQKEIMEKEREHILEEEKQIEIEKRKLAKEKEQLLSLDEKELFVELIFAVRGFYAEYSKLVDNQKIMREKIDELEITICDIYSEIAEVRNNVDSDD